MEIENLFLKNQSATLKMSPVKAKLYRVIKSYQSPYPESISFLQGERVTVGEEFSYDPDWKGWLWCESKNGNSAWTPKQFLEITESIGILKWDYDARELSVRMDEIVTVFKIVNGFGMAENIDGNRGWVPINHLEEINRNEYE